MHRTTTQTAGAVAALFALLVLAGCSDECKRNSDCRAGYTCYKGECIPDSTADADADAPPPDGADADDGTVGPDADADDAPPGPDADGDDDGGGGDADSGCTDHAQCADDNPCTVDECLMSTGECRWIAREDGEDCGDGLFCNGFETCQGGSCDSGLLPCTGGPNPCAAGGCDEDADDCRPGAAPDDTPCDNGVYCDGPDVCKEGFCQSGPPPCPGGDGVCSFAYCEEGTRACSTVAASDGTDCDDGDLCNGMDVCLSGACTPDPHRPCDDTNQCTNDLCSLNAEGVVVCDHTPATAGGPCTDIDACGGSTGRILVCEADGSGGACAAGTDAPCSDGSLCIATDCRGGTCSVTTPPPDPTPLACGGTEAGSTVAGANDVSSYGALCTGSMTGGENVFAVAVPSGRSTLQATLSGVVSTGPLSVMVLGDRCAPTTCLGSSAGGASVSVAVTGGGTYYVVVDGAAGARGLFDVSASCI